MFLPGNEATKMIGALGIYRHVVWVGRVNQWAGKQFDMKNVSDQRIQNRL
jgi:hypothetical protein